MALCGDCGVPPPHPSRFLNGNYPILSYHIFVFIFIPYLSLSLFYICIYSFNYFLSYVLIYDKGMGGRGRRENGGGEGEEGRGGREGGRGRE